MIFILVWVINYFINLTNFSWKAEKSHFGKYIFLLTFVSNLIKTETFQAVKVQSWNVVTRRPTSISQENQFRLIDPLQSIRV